MRETFLLDCAGFSAADTEMLEVHRVLKPGGRVAVYVTDRASMDRCGHHRLFDRSDLVCALNNGGFAPGQVEVRPLDLAFGVDGLLGIATKTAVCFEASDEAERLVDERELDADEVPLAHGAALQNDAHNADPGPRARVRRAADDLVQQP